MLVHWLIDVDDFAFSDSVALFQKEIPLEWIKWTQIQSSNFEPLHKLDFQMQRSEFFNVSLGFTPFICQLRATSSVIKAVHNPL